MNKQSNLFEDEKRTRRQDTYRKSSSRDGSLSCTIDAEIAIRVRRYCRLRNLNCKKFINEIVEQRIGELEKVKFENLSPDEMRNLLEAYEEKFGCLM